MSNLPVPVGETLAGKYRIERVIGEGGMGVVVAAAHLELDQLVAIKFLLDNVADVEGAERFRREARAAAKIHSDHVVRVLDVGLLEEEGVRYMVMEYLEGRDLSEELLDRKRLPVGVACGYMLEAIDAIGQAHSVGIVHRDLKPANLFLANRPDGSQRVKVLDFGISKSVGRTTVEEMSLTKTSAWIGSPLYMAPEQMQSARDVDARADIWSLGAILYEMLAGAPPYEAESLPQLCNLLITQDATPISERCPGIPADLAQVIMSCLVRDPEARIASTSAMAPVLGRYATTSTGSGMSRTLLERTELQGAQSMSHPSFGPASGFVPSGANTGFGGQEGSGARTNAAWGGTDPGKSSAGSNGALKWVAVILALVVVAGGLVVALGRDGPEESLTDEALVAAPSEPTPEAAQPASGDSTEELPSPEPTPPPEPESGESAVVENEPAPPKPVPAPPAPRPVPRATPAPRPSPAPSPEPATSPPRGDDIEDLFGGRR